MSINLEPQFLSIADLAIILNVSDQHIYNQVKNNTIPSIRLGKKWLIPISFLQSLSNQKEPA